MIEVHALFNSSIAQFFVIIFEQLKWQGLTFFALGDREHFVDVATTTNGFNGLVILHIRFDIPSHMLPLLIGHLAVQQADGTYVE